MRRAQGLTRDALLQTLQPASPALFDTGEGTMHLIWCLRKTKQKKESSHGSKSPVGLDCANPGDTNAASIDLQHH